MTNMMRNLFKKEPKKEAPPVAPVQDDKVSKDDFEVLRLLGKGSFAKVVLVRHKLNGAIYAMKVIQKANVLEHQRIQDVFTEKNILRTSTHPFLLKMHYCFQSESKLFFVMDYLQGGDLDTYLNKLPNKRVEYDTARLYAAEVLMALQYLHEKATIYRDLKPENILLTADGHAVLADFGLSKIFAKEGEEVPDTEEMRTTSFVGSPFYVAPDVLKQKQYTLTIDYWSFGILVYRMLVGKVPFVGRNMKEVFDNILYSELRFSSSIELPADAKDFITKLLNKDGTKRFHGKAVKEHPFWRGIDFDAIYNKRIPVPQWTPLPPLEEVLRQAQAPAPPQAQPAQPGQSANPQEVVNTLPGASHLTGGQQQMFEGFSYSDDPYVLTKRKQEGK